MKLYLAAPLFTLAERRFNADLAAFFRGAGHTVFLPQEIEGAGFAVSAAMIFHAEVKAIDECDVVIVCADGPDPDSGTSWECGYAFSGSKTIIVYRTDFRLFAGKEKINLMLTECANAVVYHTDVEASPLSLAQRIEMELDAMHGTGLL